jgi:hypothetical protein
LLCIHRTRYICDVIWTYMVVQYFTKPFQNGQFTYGVYAVFFLNILHSYIIFYKNVWYYDIMFAILRTYKLYTVSQKSRGFTWSSLDKRSTVSNPANASTRCGIRVPLLILNAGPESSVKIPTAVSQPTCQFWEQR